MASDIETKREPIDISSELAMRLGWSPAVEL